MLVVPEMQNAYVRRTLGTLAAVVALASSIVGSALTAHADPPPPWADDHYPDINHGSCAGGHGGAFGFGWCDGIHYPDGSYWHQVTGAGMDQMKPHCVIDTGDIQPPPAPHGGCGGNA